MDHASWPGRETAMQLRQWPTLESIACHVATERSPFAAAVLVGSLAAGRADSLSDIDLLLFAPDGGFEAAWSRRHDLRVTGALVAWDERRDDAPEIGKHAWITPDIVYVECAIATPASGFRLAEPYVLLAGALPPNLTRRPPIARSELGGGPQHPVDVAYVRFIRAVRQAISETAGPAMDHPASESPPTRRTDS